MARGPQTSASSHTKAVFHNPESPWERRKSHHKSIRGRLPRGGMVPYPGLLGGAPVLGTHRECASPQTLEHSCRLVTGEDWISAPPAQGCPSCLSPLPFAAQTPALTAPAPMLFQHVPPGPCWGLAILRALPPTPMRGRAEGNTFLIVSLPFMGCQGAEATAPHPFPLAYLCLFSFPPQPPLRTPTPPAPLMLCRWEQGRPSWPQSLPALDFLQPGHGWGGGGWGF